MRRVSRVAKICPLPAVSGLCCRPEDIAAACALPASEEAGYITGQTLGVNGGRYIA